jgi:predicted nucleotidyltransferase
MAIDDDLRRKRDEVLLITRKHGVGRVKVFGSVARGETTEESDLDLLIEVEGPTPPWFPGGLVAELEQLFGRRVQVVEPECLNEEIRARVLEEAVPL